MLRFTYLVGCLLCSSSLAYAQTLHLELEGAGRYDNAVATQRWDEALSIAQSAVDQLRSASAADKTALIAALCRLGSAQASLKEFGASEATYQEAIALTEGHPGNTDARLLQPLKGLAVTLIAQAQYDRAIPVLEQALNIGSRVEGIFDASQADLLHLLAHAQTADRQFTAAEKSLSFFVRVHEHAFGHNDARTISARVVMAEWYAYLGELSRARALLRTCIEEAERAFGGNARELVVPLRALGRSYMAQLVYGGRIIGKLTNGRDTDSVWIGHRVRGYVPPQWLQPDREASEGERALFRALSLAESIEDDQTLSVLLDLGDWFELKSNSQRALDFYRRAEELARSGTATVAPTELFSYPLNIHLPPVETPTRRARYASTPRYVLVEYAVSEVGATEEERIVESNASDQEKARALRAVDRALYRPRLINGEPVKTDGLRYRFVFR